MDTPAPAPAPVSEPRPSAPAPARDDFQITADESPALIWVAGTDGLCYWFNRGWLEFTGRTMEQEQGNGWTQGVHPDDVEGCMVAYQARFAAREPFLLEYRLRRHDGEYRWILDSGAPRHAADGRFLGYHGICFDIHERKMREEAARDHTEFISAVLDAGPECVKVISPSGDLVLMNRAGLEMLEAESIEDVQRRGLAAFLLPEHRDTYVRALAAVASGARSEIEFEVAGLRGTRRWLESRIAPLCGKDGKVLAIIGISHDVTERRARLRDLEYKAKIDALTEVPNRGHFLQVAELELGRAQRYSNPLSLLLLDIDHFKQINDQHGHKAGDRVLASVADTCRRTLREIDVVGRIGGEEFAVLLPETGAPRALEAAQRLRQAVGQTRTETGVNDALSVTVSIGVTSLHRGTTTVTGLLEEADRALYAAKHAGRNCVIVHQRAAASSGTETPR